MNTTAASFKNSDSFLSNGLAIKALGGLFQNAREKSNVKLEYLNAGLVLLSFGEIEDKVEGLFEAFTGAVGGVMNKDILTRMMNAVVTAGIDLAEKLSSYLSKATTGGLLPGGKLVRLALGIMNGLVGVHLISRTVKKMTKKMDKDGDGDITFEEFQRVALGRDSMIRKFIMWFAKKSEILQGKRSEHTEGNITVNGTKYYGFLDVEDSREDILLYTSQEDRKAKRDPVEKISLLEPCSLNEGDENDWKDGEEFSFFITDKDRKRWNIQCENIGDYFEWVDEAEEYCDAPPIPDEDSRADDEGMCCLTCC